MGDFSNFCGLFRISELYTTFYVNSGTYFLHFRDLCLCDLQFCKEWGRLLVAVNQAKILQHMVRADYFFSLFFFASLPSIKKAIISLKLNNSCDERDGKKLLDYVYIHFCKPGFCNFVKFFFE